MSDPWSDSPYLRGLRNWTIRSLQDGGAVDDEAPSATPQREPDTNFLYGTAKPGPYQTQLPLTDEMKFQQWVKTNRIPFIDSSTADYDMRGFWQALQRGDPRARTAVNPFDKQIHFPDVWKTPYHQSFSVESQYATPHAPRWVGDDQTGWMLVDRLGNIIKDERTAKQADK